MVPRLRDYLMVRPILARLENSFIIPPPFGRECLGTDPSSNLGEGLFDPGLVQHERHRADLLFVDSGRNGVPDALLKHVVHGESQRDSGERSGVAGVAFGQRQRDHERAGGIGRAEHHHHAVALAGLDELLYPPLLLQIHRARGRSDEALGRGVHDPAAGALRAGGDRLGRDAVALAERENELVMQIDHANLPPAGGAPFRSSSRLAPSAILVMRPRNRLPLATSCTRRSGPSVRPAIACGRYATAEAICPWVGENPGMPWASMNRSIAERSISPACAARAAII